MSAEGRTWREKLPSFAHHHVAPVALLLLGVLVAFGDVLGPDRGLFFRDHIEVFKPRWWAVREAFGAFELPVLTRGTRGGVPLEALLNATYTPAVLILLLGDFDATYDVFVFTHFFILSTGVYVLAMKLGSTRQEALASAVVASLSGPILSWENLVVGLMGLAYAPWTYWAFDRLLSKRSAGTVAALALASGLHAQGIMPITLVLDLAVAAILLSRARPKPSAALFGALLASGILGVGIAAIELLPVLEALPGTKRGAGFDYREASLWSLHPALLLELLMPSFWAPPDVPFASVPSFNGGRSSCYLTSLYLGSGLCVAVLAPATRVHRRATFALSAGAVAAGLVAMGHHTPIHRMIASVPPLNMDRYPIKFMIIAAACVAALVPFGLRVARERPRLLLISAAVQCLALGAIVMAIPSDRFMAFLENELYRDPSGALFQGIDRAEQVVIAADAMQRRAIHGLVFSGAMLLAALFLAHHARAGRPSTPGLAAQLAGPLVIGVILVDLAAGARLTIFGARTDYGPPREVLDQIRSDRDKLFVLAGGRIRAPVAHRSGETYFEDLMRSEISRGYWLYREIRQVKDNDSDGQSHPLAVLASNMLARFPAALGPRLFARTGVGWVSTPLEQSRPGALVFDVAGEQPHHFVPIHGVIPYVRAYARWEAVELKSIRDRNTLIDLVAGARSWGAALVPPEIAGVVGAAAASPTEAEHCERTSTTDVLPASRTGRVVVVQQSECDVLVVARETYMPGWVAWVDDEPKPILQAEFGSIAVLVPRGRHSVRFEYVARSRSWAYVSLSALLTVIGLRAVDAARRRRQKLDRPAPA